LSVFSRAAKCSRLDSDESCANVASLTDAEITLRLMKLVASAHVAHTYVGAPRLQPFRRLPLSLAWFSDGLAIVGASSEYLDAALRR
jgi:hypothetical protein